jgi:hypothetical protein
MMAAQVQIQSVQAAGQNIIVTFTVVLSGNYPTGGDSLNFTSSGTLPAIQDPAFVGMVAAIESSNLLQADVWSQGGQQIAGASSVSYDVVRTTSGSPPSCNPATGLKLKVGAVGANPTTEHAASAYEAAYTGDAVTGMAVFTKLL